MIWRTDFLFQRGKSFPFTLAQRWLSEAERYFYHLSPILPHTTAYLTYATHALSWRWLQGSNLKLFDYKWNTLLSRLIYPRKNNKIQAYLLLRKIITRFDSFTYLCRIDITSTPAYLCTQCWKCFDQNSSLCGNVCTSNDTSSFQRFLVMISFP